MSENPYTTPQAPPPIPNQAAAPQLGDNAGMRLLLPVGRSAWAIAAGYLGLLIIPGPLAIAAAIIAIISIQKSKNSPHPKHGMIRATVGIIGGIIGSIIWFNILTKG